MAIGAIAMSASSATTITVSQATRKRLGSLKEGGQTYDQVIEELLAAHPNRLTWAELGRRFREGKDIPIEDVVAESRAIRARGH
jgi:predicted CopG family antitoxin